MASWSHIQDSIFGWELLQALAWERIFRRKDADPKTQHMFEQFEQRYSQPEAYGSALAHAHEARLECANLFRDCDVLLVPAAAGEAPEGIGNTGTGDTNFNGAWSMLRLPCLTLPMGLGSAGLPIGLQLVARRGEDTTLLNAAAYVEACLTA
ncbi:amidase family protein [Bradyrhizobium sp. CCBAU 11386]|uniref:amidase family protein n=1 Tax=Bradyrhizobium sp. CCBAU 11386 TaxID=1630837 RepID=UPI00230209A5|nr:amidase family protein [Bradyrhizobium sp. CCBAU 11386]